MIDKSIVKDLVEQWLEGKDYFLVDIEINSDDKIVVEIDHADGVWIEDCVELSRFIEDHLDREQEDFELEVGSAGLIMAILGGSVLPAVQAMIIDSNVQFLPAVNLSFIVPVVCFAVVMLYGLRQRVKN